MSQESTAQAAAQKAAQKAEQKAEVFVSTLQVADEPEEAPEAEQEAPEEPPAKVASLPTDAGESDVPEWALVPANLKVPRGRQVYFLRFPQALTGNREKGERQCIVWTLSDGEEKMANDRTGGSASRAPAEFSKQMIRAVDGVVVSWAVGQAAGPGSIDAFWREVGPKGRNLLMRIYTQLHLASQEEVLDFFESCVAVRTAR